MFPKGRVTFSVIVLVLLVLGATSARAQVKCGLFSSDRACQRSAAPNVHVDFAKGLRFEKPAPPLSSQTADRRVAVSPARQARDCQMIRSADRNLDPRMVKAPASGVNYRLRVIEAPGCPIK